MRASKTLAALAMAAILGGCASSVPLQQGQVGAITRDAAPTQIDQALGQATVVAQYEFKEGEGQYTARHYNLQTGTQQQMTMVCTPTCIPIFITVPVLTEYVVIQTLPERKVHAWGTLEELSKDADPSVSGLMPTVKQRLADAKAAKK